MTEIIRMAFPADASAMDIHIAAAQYAVARWAAQEAADERQITQEHEMTQDEARRAAERAEQAESVKRHAQAADWAREVAANFAALGPHATLADMDAAARAARALVYGDEVTR